MLADDPRRPGRGRRVGGVLVLVVPDVLGVVVGGLLPWWDCFVVGWVEYCGWVVVGDEPRLGAGCESVGLRGRMVAGLQQRRADVLFEFPV